MRTISCFFAFAVLVASSATAFAKSPVQIAPDPSDTIILVNKQVGTEQWVISLDLDDETLTGNVFDLSGKPPTFFSCTVDFSPDNFTSVAEIAAETLTLTCNVAGGCNALPCEVEGQPLGTTPTIGGSFFLP